MTRAARLDVGPRVCRWCGRPVLRVYDTDVGLRVDVEPDPMPVTDVLVPGALVYERHPRLGWQIQHAPRRRGFPLHRMHSCPRQPRAKARAA